MLRQPYYSIKLQSLFVLLGNDFKIILHIFKLVLFNKINVRLILCKSIFYFLVCRFKSGFLLKSNLIYGLYFICCFIFVSGEPEICVSSSICFSNNPLLWMSRRVSLNFFFHELFTFLIGFLFFQLQSVFRFASVVERGNFKEISCVEFRHLTFYTSKIL